MHYFLNCRFRVGFRICVRRKENRTLEMDLEDQEIQAVLDQPRPPPYSPPENSSPRISGTTATVQAGLSLALPVTLHVINPREPPPVYEESSMSVSSIRFKINPFVTLLNNFHCKWNA